MNCRWHGRKVLRMGTMSSGVLLSALSPRPKWSPVAMLQTPGMVAQSPVPWRGEAVDAPSLTESMGLPAVPANSLAFWTASHLWREHSPAFTKLSHLERASVSLNNHWSVCCRHVLGQHLREEKGLNTKEHSLCFQTNIDSWMKHQKFDCLDNIKFPMPSVLCTKCRTLRVPTMGSKDTLPRAEALGNTLGARHSLLSPLPFCHMVKSGWPQRAGRMHSWGALSNKARILMPHCHYASALRSRGQCDQSRDPRVRQMGRIQKAMIREAGLWSGFKRIQIKGASEPPRWGFFCVRPLGEVDSNLQLRTYKVLQPSPVPTHIPTPSQQSFHGTCSMCP